jgi:hypothetical protein
VPRARKPRPAAFNDKDTGQEDPHLTAARHGIPRRASSGAYARKYTPGINRLASSANKVQTAAIANIRHAYALQAPCKYECFPGWGPRDYFRRVIIAAALAGLVVFVVALLAAAARLVHLGNLDALALAEKVAVPEPDSALDWPDLQVLAVVAQPDDQPLVLLHVIWSAHPGQAAILLLALDEADRRSSLLLSRWCACHASVCPMRRPGAGLELRRRQSLERVHALLVSEDIAPASS